MKDSIPELQQMQVALDRIKAEMTRVASDVDYPTVRKAIDTIRDSAYSLRTRICGEYE